MIVIKDNIFQLHTAKTSYIFRATDAGLLEHLYYGPYLGEISKEEASAIAIKVPCQAGNMIAYDKEYLNVTPEDICLEFSGPGKGDIREPAIELIHPDGSATCDFVFDTAEIFPDKPEYETLPGSYGLKENEHLCITLKEKAYGLILELHYYVYAACDVICKSARLINMSKEPVRIQRLISGQLDLPDSGYIMTAFTGAWAREMEKTDTPVVSGMHSVSSSCGFSSGRANPFFMISRPETNENAGECFGFNLIYSGNHFECAQVNAFGKTRILNGINPQGFSWLLDPGESFEAPESVMSFSSAGHCALSLNMQRFVKEHIVRGAWKNKARPVLINSWEAFYFKFTENSLIDLAKAAKDVGAELFVLDDGWFGKRNDDTSSLGDWFVNENKIPSGLKGLSEKINAIGLGFGLWVEPEMINTDSGLYRSHPEWVMEIPGKAQSEGRNERCLDLANPDAAEYIIDTMSRLFSSAKISYVKWDVNRFFSDVYSPYLSKERQGECAHRYILGLYKVMKALTERFPKILFEGCASGGGRFDLGILSFFPQIWASDNTDPICRAKIQEGYSFGYPLSCAGAHVSASPNHQTLRKAPLETRFNVAAFGLLGYECDLLDMKKGERKEIKDQIVLYKKWRGVLQTGYFYRLESGNVHSWICVSGDKKKAVGMVLQEMVRPNTQYLRFKAKGLKSGSMYHFYNIPSEYDIRELGSLVNAAAPLHIKDGSVIRAAASRFIKLPGESEDYIVSGRVLMNPGIALKGAFTATGYDAEVRLFQDFASRMYFIEEV